jgi:hypothetical protein
VPRLGVRRELERAERAGRRGGGQQEGGSDPELQGGRAEGLPVAALSWTLAAAWTARSAPMARRRGMASSSILITPN